jgi:hypothetical protein
MKPDFAGGAAMSHAFEVSDEQYALLDRAAKEQGRTPEDLFLGWVMEIESLERRAHPTYYETDEWLRHLGATDEQIREAERLAALDDEEDRVVSMGGQASADA